MSHCLSLTHAHTRCKQRDSSIAIERICSGYCPNHSAGQEDQRRLLMAFDRVEGHLIWTEWLSASSLRGRCTWKITVGVPILKNGAYKKPRVWFPKKWTCFINHDSWCYHLQYISACHTFLGTSCRVFYWEPSLTENQEILSLSSHNMSEPFLCGFLVPPVLVFCLQLKPKASLLTDTADPQSPF